MKFKSITLHNFMRYKGDNTLLFSTNPDKNVTVVLGENTFGKTTLAQAFRWGLYEDYIETNYTKKKDVVILNNEVIAEMSMNSIKEVSVEIIVVNENDEWKFTRKAQFKRINPQSLVIKQVTGTQLTMQISHKGIWGEIINDDGRNTDKKSNKAGCVQETIDNMFPKSLSNYFFFDGERWRDSSNKTSDIRDSVNTILGISGLEQMKNHLKDKSPSVLSTLRKKIQGSVGEYEQYQKEIAELERQIEINEGNLDSIKSAIETVKKDYDSTLATLNDNRKVEDDIREYNKIGKDIDNWTRVENESYSDIVKEFSKVARYYASGLLPKLNEMLDNMDLKGKDIPGITVDTLDYLLDNEECICGNKLIEGNEAYDNIIKLKKLVPPEMLGGAAGKLKDMLEFWQNETKDLPETIIKKADDFTAAQERIDELEVEHARLEKVMDRKTNLGAIRKRNEQAKEKLDELRNKLVRTENAIKAAKEQKLSKENQLDVVARQNKENENVYKAIAYAQALYEKADKLASGRQNTVLTDLNEIIGRNFQRMFNDHEKYSRIEKDYKIHVYYHQLGELQNYEEENLSNGETIAINFVFIVSILELAKQYRNLEKADSEYGMENAILELPLVLDGPFSALSNVNTGLIASKLPEFAEQVVIFMLDKDWESSGLDDYTLPEYCYRVTKEATSNSSEIEQNQGGYYG